MERPIPIEDFRDHFLALCWTLHAGLSHHLRAGRLRSALWAVPGFKQEFYYFIYGGRRDA